MESTENRAGSLPSLRFPQFRKPTSVMWLAMVIILLVEKQRLNVLGEGRHNILSNISVNSRCFDHGGGVRGTWRLQHRDYFLNALCA